VVYYVSPGKGKVTAFKPVSKRHRDDWDDILSANTQGFRMLVGDANKRVQGTNSLKSQTCFRCYSGPNFGGDNAAPCQDAKHVFYIRSLSAY
jgi:hypothetical protein